MKLRIFTEPQLGADYQTLRAVALTAETIGHLQATRADTAFLAELVRRMSARRT